MYAFICIDRAQTGMYNWCMKISLIPKSRLGQTSVWLFVIFIVLFTVFLLLVASGQKGGDTFFSNLLLSVPMFVAAISAVSAFFTGIVGIIISKERSVFVFLAIAVGFLVLVFGIGEFAFPH